MAARGWRCDSQRRRLCSAGAVNDNDFLVSGRHIRDAYSCCLLLHCNGRRDVGDTARLLFQLLCVSVTLVVLRAQQPKMLVCLFCKNAMQLVSLYVS
jgi:hypothetical protein